jgi:hypothetical protein
MPFANGQFISWADYLEANRPGVDQMEQKVQDKSGEDYAAAVGALHANGSEASAGAAAGGSGQPMDYGSYKTYLAKRRAVQNTASYGANAQNPWDAALLEGTGAQGRIQSHAKDELGELDVHQDWLAKNAAAARSRYVQDNLRKQKFGGLTPVQQQPTFNPAYAHDQHQADVQRRSQANQSKSQGTWGMSDLDWGLKAGRITTAEYDRAQTDEDFYNQLKQRF